MAEFSLLPDTARIGRTALLVTDLDGMIDFYRDVVGLSVLTRRETTATLGVGETPLLVLDRDESASPRGHDQAGLFHNAFKVPTRTALGAALERIRERGHLETARPITT